jgi:alpha-tubulin suppressor-like RCC1 family protein
MPNPNTNFRDSSGLDLGNKLITKEYLMSVYPQIANQLITPELWIWGSGFSGQLGNNATADRSTPVTTFAGGANWKQISCGNNHTAAIKTNGTLWTWGSNYHGQLGSDSSGFDVYTPITTFGGGTNWKQVSCGDAHTAAIKTDGTLWTWGFNSYGGQLGVNDTEQRETPITTLAGGTDWKQVSCGRFRIAAIKTDGTLWIWGMNNYGQLGNNNPGSESFIPITTFAGGTNWKQVACGYSFTAAIKTDGTLWTWGSNSFGQLGNNNPGSDAYTPITTFAGGTNWKQVSCGYNYTAAIKTDGTLWSWGSNGSGQIGNDNPFFDQFVPGETFGGGTNWKQVSCAGQFTAAIKTDGTLWTWGSNGSGQIGNNTTAQRNTPVTTFAGGTNWKQVAGGDQYTAAIKTSDDLQGI